jgi:hypothetical protein
MTIRLEVQELFAKLQEEGSPYLLITRKYNESQVLSVINTPNYVDFMNVLATFCAMFGKQYGPRLRVDFVETSEGRVFLTSGSPKVEVTDASLITE